MENYYQTKSINASVKDVDKKTGIVTGYFAAFDFEDSDKDVIEHGAFTKSIVENGPESKKPRIFHLSHHDVSKVLSKPTVLKEDNYGLYFESLISKTSWGKDILTLYEDGVISEHSIGFIPTKVKNNNNGVQNILEVKLFEGSTVTFGANENTPYLGMKDLEIKSKSDMLLGKINILSKSCRNGNFTDETFQLLEIELKQLQAELASYVSLQKQDEPINITPTVEKPEPELLKALNQFRESIKN